MSNLQKKKSPVKLIIAIVCIAVGLVGSIVAFNKTLNKDDEPVFGWQNIEVTDKVSCSNDFILQYDVGSAEELRIVSEAYTTALKTGSSLFDEKNEIVGVNNLAYLNAHNSEKVTVHPSLYHAFELFKETGRRDVYGGLLHHYYEGLLANSATIDDSFISEMADFASDESAVCVDLLPNDQVCLKVSPEYIALAKKQGCTTYLDFGFMKNAFIADFVADYLTEKGYTKGYIKTSDGNCMRCFDERKTDVHTFAVNCKGEKGITTAGNLKEKGKKSFVWLHNYAFSLSEQEKYKTLKDNSVVYPYIDTKTGMCLSSRSDLVTTSTEMSCGELLVNSLTFYMTDTFVSSLEKPKDLCFVYVNEKTVYLEDTNVEITTNAGFTAKFI